MHFKQSGGVRELASILELFKHYIRLVYSS